MSPSMGVPSFERLPVAALGVYATTPERGAAHP
jgi:hypothetical protein